MAQHPALRGAGIGAGAGTLIGLAGGPIGALAGAGIGALWVKGQKHWKANQWVQGYQNPWGTAATALIDRLNQARAEGTLSYDDAVAAQKEFDTNLLDFEDQAKAFEVKGGDQATVIAQARAQLNPTIRKWKESIQQHIDALKPADAARVSEEAPTAGTLLAPIGETAASLAQKRAEQQRKRSQSGGRQSTLLGGTYGGGRQPQKTLLGY
jgi:hypothetical protein